MTIILSVLLFLAIFGTTAFAVLYFRANLISQKAEEEAKIALEDAKKFEEAYLKIKNAPKVVLEKATLEAYRLEESAKAKSKELLNQANAQRTRILEVAKTESEELINQAKIKTNLILEAAKVESDHLTNQANQLKNESVEQAKQITNDANKKVKELKAQIKNLENVAT